VLRKLLKKTNIETKRSLNLGGILCLLVTAFFIYHLLLKDSLLSLSISLMSALTSHMTKHWHVLVVGLIPVYLALIIFGAAILSIYLGSAIQRWLTQRWQE
jgi:ABC-type transport system involved in cytochrome c biogenesis permease component